MYSFKEGWPVIDHDVSLLSAIWLSATSTRLHLGGLRGRRGPSRVLNLALAMVRVQELKVHLAMCAHGGLCTPGAGS